RGFLAAHGVAGGGKEILVDRGGLALGGLRGSLKRPQSLQRRIARLFDALQVVLAVSVPRFLRRLSRGGKRQADQGCRRNPDEDLAEAPKPGIHRARQRKNGGP